MPRAINRGIRPKPNPPSGEALAELADRYHLDDKKIIKSIAKHRGLITHVAREFKIPLSNLQRYVKHRPLLQEALTEAREAMGDVAENKLYSRIRAGDTRCLLYYLSTVHRGRGYGLNRNDLFDPHDQRPVYVETVNVIAVPSGTFLPPEPKTIDN